MVTGRESALTRLTATAQVLSREADTLAAHAEQLRVRAETYRAAVDLAADPAGHHWASGRALDRPAELRRIQVTCGQVAELLIAAADANRIVQPDPTVLTRYVHLGRQLLAAGQPTTSGPTEGVLWLSPSQPPPAGLHDEDLTADGLAPALAAWRRTSNTTVAGALIVDTTRAAYAPASGLPRYVAGRLFALEPASGPGWGLDGYARQVIRGALADGLPEVSQLDENPRKTPAQTGRP